MRVGVKILPSALLAMVVAVALCQWPSRSPRWWPVKSPRLLGLFLGFGQAGSSSLFGVSHAE